MDQQLRIITVILFLIFIGGCENFKAPTPKQVGSLGGAVSGAMVGCFVGSRFGGGAGALVFTIIGATVGGATGYYSVLKDLAPGDVSFFEKSTGQAMEETGDGQIYNWVNPKTGVAGTLQPTRSYLVSGGSLCRDFVATIASGKNVGRANAKACRLEGSWKIYSSLT